MSQLFVSARYYILFYPLNSFPLIHKHTILRLFGALMICGIMLTINGCSANSGKAVQEGIIEYDAKVVDFNHPLAELAPGAATLKFKSDKLEMEMTAMGMFKNTYVCNLTDKTIIQMVNFLDLKQASIDNEAEIIKENDAYKLIIEETNETKVIAGYKCKKIKVKKVSNPSVAFDAYYTSEMGSDKMNELSPYSGVKGMLMQYRLSKMGLEMEFTAKSVKKAKISDDSFEIPRNFKRITKEEMQKFFNQF